MANNGQPAMAELWETNNDQVMRNPGPWCCYAVTLPKVVG